MTPDELRSVALVATAAERNAVDAIRSDLWTIAAEVCERLDRIAAALEGATPSRASGPKAVDLASLRLCRLPAVIAPCAREAGHEGACRAS